MSASNPFQPGGSAGGFATSGGAFAALGNGDAGETSQAGDGEGGEEEENTGESIANAVDPSVTILFSSPNTTFYVQMPEEGGKLVWSNKGKGTLTLRKAKEGTARPYVVLTTETGRVMLNASLHKDIKAAKNGDKKVMTFLRWALTEGGGPETRQVFFTLPGSEMQEKCLEQINSIGQQ